jgi:hypothetical protein
MGVLKNRSRNGGQEFERAARLGWVRDSVVNYVN